MFNNKDEAKETDVLEGLAISVECDQNPGAARSKLEGILGPATLIVRSGGSWVDPQTGELCDKLHLHWRLKEPPQGKDIAKLKQARDIATMLVGGDASNKPICHPIRWPGSWHKKSAPRLCEVVDYDLEREIDLDVALEKLLQVAPAQAQAQGGAGAGAQQSGGPLDWDQAFGDIISGKQFHPTLTPLAASFAAHGVPERATRATLHALLVNTQTTDTERLNRRDVEIGKLRNTVRSGYQKFYRAQQQAGELFDPWARYVVPDFPLDVLPLTLQEFVTSQSKVIGCCQAGMAMATLAGLSGAASHRFSLKMMEYGQWHEHPRLWVLLVGDPSRKKTPTINTVTKPLERLQAELYRTYREAVRQWKAAGEQGDEPKPPPRYVVADVTMEKLAEILSRADRGLLVKRDELTGWIGQMDKYAMPRTRARIEVSGYKPLMAGLIPLTASSAAKPLSKTYQRALLEAFNPSG